MSMRQKSVIVCLAVGIFLAHTTPASSLSSTKERENRKFFGGYRIAPKFCNATRLAPGSPKPRGPTICMFNHECSQRQGEVVGACMDGFLFGTCCLLKGEEHTNSGVGEAEAADDYLEEMPESNLAAVSSYERYGSAAETALDRNKQAQQDQDLIDQFMMDPAMVEKYHLLNEATSYSYSTLAPEMKTTFSTEDESGSDSEPTTNLYLPSIASQTYSDELPLANRFEDDSTATDFDYTTRNGDEDSTTNREITDMTDLPTTALFRKSTTARPVRVTYAKPQFKPKPTKFAQNNYVKQYGIYRINNSDAKRHKPWPPYASGVSSTEPIQGYDSTETTLDATYTTFRYKPETRKPTSRPSFVTSTTLATRKPTTYSSNDYGSSSSSSIYSPSPNYVSVSQSTSKRPPRPSQSTTPIVEVIKTTVGASKRPLSSSTTNRVKSSTSKSTTKKKNRPTATSSRPVSIKIASTSTKVPTTVPATRKPPSTSYVYSPLPTRRPQDTKRPPTKQSTIITVADFTTNRLPPEYVVQSRPVNENRPYIQIANSGTSERPSPTVHITPKPAIVASSTYGVNTKLSTASVRPTSPAGLPQGISVMYNQSPAILIPAPADFENEGYFGISTTVRPGLEHTVTQTSIYTIVPNSQKRPAIEPYTPAVVHDDDTIETLPANEFVNFPPVRNPNLNATGYIGVGSDEDDEPIRNTTPAFIEDEVVHNKLDLLVSKIVASLQPNFNGLADMVYDRTNVTIVRDTPEPSKPTTTTRKPAGTKKPTPKRPTTKPGAAKPQADSPSTTKRPQKATTKKPAGASKKPATTKRPVTKLSTSRTTTKPTKRATTSSTTASSSSSDSDYESSDAEENEIETEEDTLPSFGNAKIQCGVRPQVKSGRIVGGKAAQFGEWPWQVLVKESTWLGLFTKNKCGGVLISNSYVMTAAHCQPGFLASLVAVMGEHDISGELEAKRAVTKNVKQIIVHRRYDPATFENDLALLQLETPVHYDTHIVPICLPPDSADFTGRKATITGWGRLKYNGGVPSILQEVQVPVMENSVCQEMFHTAGHNKKILPSFLCAGYANGQRDSCEGDSGGPLVLQRPDGRYELVGTVSHGIKCAAPYLPGVYMRTTFYKEWIKSVANIK